MASASSQPVANDEAPRALLFLPSETKLECRGADVSPAHNADIALAARKSRIALPARFGAAPCCAACTRLPRLSQKAIKDRCRVLYKPTTKRAEGKSNPAVCADCLSYFAVREFRHK